MKKKIHLITIIAILLCVSYGMLHVNADEVVTIRVPSDAKCYIAGEMIPETHFTEEQVLSGRIHEMAAETLGKAYSYRECQIPRSELERVKVYDWMQKELPCKETAAGIFDYTLPSALFCSSMEETVIEAARAYYNRISGFSGNFSQYYRQGSNAYTNIVNADNATKWGRFIAPGQVSQITCSDIFAYSSCAFSAAATVESEKVGEYAEYFEIHFLFENDGSGWCVTNFTFMP